jgi:AcrR family transcriptional regulator
MRVKTEEKRRAIIEAAMAVFLERGYDAASMALVSARVGGSKQTLYSYFPSKDALFMAVIMEKGAGRIDPAFQALEEMVDLREGLTRFATALSAFLVADEIVALRRMVIAESGRSSLGRQFFDVIKSRGWSRLADLFSRAMDQGRLRRADPWLAATQFQALCEGGLFQERLYGAREAASDADIVQAAEGVVDLFMRGYGAGG